MKSAGRSDDRAQKETPCVGRFEYRAELATGGSRATRLALPPGATWISIPPIYRVCGLIAKPCQIESGWHEREIGLRCTATPWFLSAPFKEERKTSVVATVEQLAELVHGRLVGDGSVSIRSARPVAEAGPGDITFIENDRFAKLLRASPASAAIVGPHFSLGQREAEQSLAVIEVDDPMAAFLAVRTHLIGEQKTAGPVSIPRRVSPRRPRSARMWRSIRLRMWAKVPCR